MNHEINKSIDRAHIAAPGTGVRDVLNWQVLWTCEKWSEDACRFVRKRLGFDTDKGRRGHVRSWMLRKLIAVNSPDFILVEIPGNLLVNAGIQRVMDAAMGPATGQVWNSTHAGIGVGNSSTAATAADTDLGAAAGSTNRQFEGMNATFPSRSGQTVTYQSDFGSSVANFHWQEWCVDQNAATPGTTVTAPMLNHKVEDLGTKTTGTWTLSGAITIS